MTREKMYEKYHDVLASIGEAHGGDLAVSLDMLIYMYKVRAGILEGGDVYDGIPEDFDYESFGEDYAALTA